MQDHIRCSVEKEAKLVGFGAVAAKPVCAKVKFVLFDVEFGCPSATVNLFVKSLGRGIFKARDDVAQIYPKRRDSDSCYDPPGFTP